MRFDPNRYPLDPGLRLLEASAGTGKTFALAHLTLRLISEAAMPLPSLLVVTFTDAAAAELRSRIGQRLQDALAGLEALARGDALPEADPVLQQWWQQAPQDQSRRDWISRVLMALEQLDAADITTIHGFCSRSLRRQAINSGAAMQQQLETDATALVPGVVQELWQQQLLTLPLPQLQGLVRAGLTADGLAAGRLRRAAEPPAVLQSGLRSRPAIRCMTCVKTSWLNLLMDFISFLQHPRRCGSSLTTPVTRVRRLSNVMLRRWLIG